MTRRAYFRHVDICILPADKWLRLCRIHFLVTRWLGCIQLIFSLGMSLCQETIWGRLNGVRMSGLGVICFLWKKVGSQVMSWWTKEHPAWNFSVKSEGKNPCTQSQGKYFLAVIFFKKRSLRRHEDSFESHFSRKMSTWNPRSCRWRLMNGICNWSLTPFWKSLNRHLLCCRHRWWCCLLLYLRL